MGSGIAQTFAQHGFAVLLVDVADPLLDRARQGVEKSLDAFVKKGKLTTADRDATLTRLTTHTSLDRLVEADYIVGWLLAKGRKYSLDGTVSLPHAVAPDFLERVAHHGVTVSRHAPRSLFSSRSQQLCS